MSGYNVAERVSQLLGIDKFPEHTWLCTFEVNVNQLFRPAYQPNIAKGVTKSECFDTDSQKWKLKDGFFENKFKNITGHLAPKEWLATLQKSKEYPWTRLGYTYDWCPNAPEGHFGVTEFVIVPNSKISNIKTYKLRKDGK